MCDHRRPEIRDHYQHKIGRSLWFEEWKRKRDIVWKRRENVKKKGKKDFFSGEKKSGRAKKSARAHYTARSLLMKLTWRSENIIYVRCLLLKLNSFQGRQFLSILISSFHYSWQLHMIPSFWGIISIHIRVIDGDLPLDEVQRSFLNLVFSMKWPVRIWDQRIPFGKNQ